MPAVYMSACVYWLDLVDLRCGTRDSGCDFVDTFETR